MRKTSLVDYPGKVAGVLFFPGCNLRCPWCHNRELVVGGEDGLIDIEEALGFISKRKQVLGGVVLSGGEPLLFYGLPQVIRKIKSLGLAVKIDTNGTNPAALEKICSDAETRPDYIALDLKLAPSRYAELLAEVNPQSTPTVSEKLLHGAEFIKSSQIPHEYRTLALPNNFITAKDIEELAPLVDESPWYFRLFRPGNCLDPGWDAMEVPGMEEANALAHKAKELGKKGISPTGGRY
nr:anaerobic ribonucleoside-triphosphate reductase activating protein [Leadbettera azotonutricia]